MNLSDVAVFVEAVRAGSLAAAARRLNIPPMAASRRLVALEGELGVRLMHRTTRALSLTPEGEDFFPHAQMMMDAEANGRASLRPTGSGVSGLLRVTASVPFGCKMVTPMLPAFMRANPDLRVDLTLTDSVIDIVALGIDLALRIAPLRDSGLIGRKLVENPRGLYAAPVYLAERGLPRTLTDLGGHECLTGSGTTHWSFACEGRPVRQRVSGRFTANSVDALLRLCLEGCGIVNLSAWNVAEDVAAGRLVEIFLAGAQVKPWNVWAVYPTSQLVPPKVTLFVGALQSHLEVGFNIRK
ncbi:MAG TPA: LysR family transcriptional regulator [Candidatus Sulfotelmatobacter sp.]|jgi:DNA-binding transcriptional LysR family regulator|nr:LysR family transcriptional regulator [Candidatus Sulfotelmatobacter sp.]